MPTREILQKLNAQVNREFNASHLYLRLSDWCTEHNLNGAATFLRNQAQNNVTYMMSLFDYMKQEGADPVIGAAPVSACECGSLEELFLCTLDDLNQRSASLSRLMLLAKACHDETTCSVLDSLSASHAQDRQFLQALLEEVRAASREGVPVADTDQCFFNLVNYEHH
ncbi:MAG TPA: non-heme ferritin-like protein [Franconibacter pulveris]|nr:non-heme ferritin-like protein [Franconibacter pulveris]